MTGGVNESQTQSGTTPGLALAYINLAMWSYNLFVFLLLRVLLLYFKTPPVDMAYTLVPIPKQKQEAN